MTTAAVRDIQRESFRGYVVAGPIGARVCCGVPGCPEEMRAPTVWRIEEMLAGHWREDALRGWVCPGCAGERT